MIYWIRRSLHSSDSGASFPCSTQTCVSLTVLDPVHPSSGCTFGHRCSPLKCLCAVSLFHFPDVSQPQMLTARPGILFSPLPLMEFSIHLGPFLKSTFDFPSAWEKNLPLPHLSFSVIFSFFFFPFPVLEMSLRTNTLTHLTQSYVPNSFLNLQFRKVTPVT